MQISAQFLTLFWLIDNNSIGMKWFRYQEWEWHYLINDTKSIHRNRCWFWSLLIWVRGLFIHWVHRLWTNSTELIINYQWVWRFWFIFEWLEQQCGTQELFTLPKLRMTFIVNVNAPIRLQNPIFGITISYSDSTSNQNLIAVYFSIIMGTMIVMS